MNRRTLKRKNTPLQPFANTPVTRPKKKGIELPSTDDSFFNSLSTSNNIAIPMRGGAGVQHASTVCSPACRHTCSPSTPNISPNIQVLTQKFNTSNGITYPTVFPEVSVLTTRVINTIPQSSFVWLEKTDGERYVLLIESNEVYRIQHGELIHLYHIPGSQYVKRSMFDTEHYNNTFYIFDVIMYDGQDMSNQPFPTRMANAPNITTSEFALTPKTFEVVTSWDALVAFTNNYKSPLTNNVIDGVVVQRVDTPYYTALSTPGCYKLKKSVLNTIDFVLKRSENGFRLYLGGTSFNITRNLKAEPKHNKYQEQDVGYNINEAWKNPREIPTPTLILFSSPYREHLSEFIPRTDWDKTNYFPENVTEIDKLMQDILANPNEYNNKIVELSLANDGWVPMRVRHDKDHPNGYNVGIMNCGVIFAPLNTKESYFKPTQDKDDLVVDAYHNVNRILRRYIIEKSINGKGERLDAKKLSVIDLAGGRGGDEFNLYHSGATNIFAVDSDRDALVQYVTRTPNMYKQKYEPMFGSTDNVNPGGLCVNAIYGMLGLDNSSIVDDITGRNEFKQCMRTNGGVDYVFMNYAIHYLCYSRKCLETLGDMLNKVLKPGGLFVFSFFDGDEILEKMKNGKVSYGDRFIIERVSNSVGNETYGVESDTDAVWARMPLPTIDVSGYRVEPLVREEWLIATLVKKCGLRIFERYEPVNDVTEQVIDNIEGKDLVLNYLRLIRVWTLRKNI